MGRRAAKEPAPFEFTGGAVCLDLANTVDDRPDPARRHDRLETYGDLIVWSYGAGLLTAREARQLRRRAAARPAQAAAALARTRALREAIYRVFAAVAAHRPVPPRDLAHLQAVWRRAVRARHLVGRPGQFRWRWRAAGALAFDRPAWEAALDAAALLTSDRLARVRCCAAACGWLFLDTSRNRSRRWCDMRVCGNRAKVRRFYARRRLAATAPSPR